MNIDSEPKIVLITGPSGAGKSTVAKALAKTGKGMWAYVGQDDIRMLVKAGYRHADVTWTDETRRQWEVSVAITCDAIQRYYEHGINCVADFFAPPEEFEKYKQALGDLSYTVVVLLPGAEEAARRNNLRKGHAKMDEAKIRENYEWFTVWKPSEAAIIDTSLLSLEDTVGIIRRLIDPKKL